MSNDPIARGISAGSAVGLLFTAIVLCYLNLTTNGFFGSSAFMLAIGVTSLAFCSKLAFAFGVENKWIDYADRVVSIIPILAVIVNVYQILHFTSDGMDGFMAGFALIALMIVVCFGLIDAAASWLGTKFHKAHEITDLIAERARAVRDAARGAPHSIIIALGAMMMLSSSAPTDAQNKRPPKDISFINCSEMKNTPYVCVMNETDDLVTDMTCEGKKGIIFNGRDQPVEMPKGGVPPHSMTIVKFPSCKTNITFTLSGIGDRQTGKIDTDLATVIDVPKK